VQVSLEECVHTLQDIRNDHNPLEKPTYLAQLQKDLSNGIFKEHQVAKLKKTTQFTNAKNQFIDAVLQNLAKRYTLYLAFIMEIFMPSNQSSITGDIVYSNSNSLQVQINHINFIPAYSGHFTGTFLRCNCQDNCARIY
jgi:hypothetical protein